MPTAEELAEQAEVEGEGRSIEELADDPDFDGGDDAEVYIEGTTGQLSLSVGGRKPDTSACVMRSVQVRVEGQYTKGETLVFRVIGRVDEVDFVDVHDEYGTVTASKRIQKVKPISVERVASSDQVG